MDFETMRAIVIGTLTHDFLRYVIVAGGIYLAINLAGARALRPRKIRPESPGWAQMRREIAVSMRTVLVFAANGMAIAFGATLGWVPIYESVADFGWGWFWASTVMVVIAHDAWFYWTHRMMHRPRLYRLLHGTHHRSHNPTPFTSYAFDTGEAAVHAVFLVVFVAVVPMHPAALLIFAMHMMIRNVIGHCGIELFPARNDGRPLVGWMTTVTHHDLHHANARYNMGLYFTWWDRLMGTEHPEYLAHFARVAHWPGRDRDRPRHGQSPARSTPTGVILAGVILAGLATLPGTASRAGTLDGIYATPGLWMVVRFEPCTEAPETVCGRLVWAWDPTSLNHVSLGETVLWGLAPENDGWTGGKLRHPGSGWVFRGSARYLATGDLLLTGCAGPVCDRQVWRALGPVQKELAGLN